MLDQKLIHFMCDLKITKMGMEKLCLSKTTYDSSLLLFSIRKIKFGKKIITK